VMFRERLPLSEAGRELVTQIAVAGGHLGQEQPAAAETWAAA
jgi:hypothetical protein